MQFRQQFTRFFISTSKVALFLSFSHIFTPKSPFACNITQKIFRKISPNRFLLAKVLFAVLFFATFRLIFAFVRYIMFTKCANCAKILSILPNLGVFSDSPGVEGDLISVSQSLLRKKGKLKLNANTSKTSRSFNRMALAA